MNSIAERLNTYIGNWTKEEFLRCLETAGTKTAFDWQCCYGNTVLEKYESLYVKLVEITNVLIRKSGGGCFWIMTSPELGSVLAKNLTPSSMDLLPQGTESTIWIGTIERKWMLFTNSQFPTNRMLISRAYLPTADVLQSASVLIANFVEGDDDDGPIDLLRVLRESSTKPDSNTSGAAANL